MEMKTHPQVMVAMPGSHPAGTLQWLLCCPVCGGEAVERAGYTQGSGDH